MRQWVATEEGKQNVHIPFRQSALTRVLANSFTRPNTYVACTYDNEHATEWPELI